MRYFVLISSLLALPLNPAISTATPAVSPAGFPILAQNNAIPVAGQQGADLQKPKQVVIISFDGAHDNKLWQRSLALGQETGAHFTYFLSCVFYMQRADRAQYQPPRMKAGRSNVGFASDKAEVSTRLNHVWQAHQNGHEIASHGCGHFDGKAWSAAEWQQELKAFNNIVGNAYQANKIENEPQGWRNLVDTQIKGFRAPYLSDDKPVQSALKDTGFAYQASGVTSGPQLPKKLGSLYSFGLPLIPEGPAQKPVIAMDYNLYVRHSGAKEKPEQAQLYEQRSYDAFMQAFNKQYRGQRIPLQLGFHFVLMNNGAYWNALERFARDVCKRDDVGCISYQDYLNNPALSPQHAALEN